jgi:hypothetical protein
MNPERPISDRKLEANRRNSQKSRGPRTDEGKRTASHNSRRHGFTGRVNILTPENREAHDKFCDELIQSFHPETPMERQFAHSIAEDSWRLNGLRAAETNILAEAAAWSHTEIEVAVSTAHAYIKDAKELQLLSLYEQRINRAIYKNLSELKTLQSERSTARRQALEEAKLLAQLDLLNIVNTETTPAAAAATITATRKVNGFVFSTTEINLAINHDNRLKQARDLYSTPPSRSRHTLARAA